jgi:hypothetical protein
MKEMYLLSDLLDMIPPKHGVGQTTARYWLKTGLFGAAEVTGGGGPGYPRSVNWQGAAIFLVAAEIYSIGVSGLGFEQTLLTISRRIKDRWRDLADLAAEAPTLAANGGEGSILEVAVCGRDDDGRPLFHVRNDWDGGKSSNAGAVIRLNLSRILEPLLERGSSNTTG